MKSREEILEGLTPQQRKIATSIEGKYMVLAGSGSGKTFVLLKRIEYLISLGVKPYEIVAFTFTNKVAKEMKERMAESIGETALDVNISTIHSLCMRILLTHQNLLGYENMTVIDTDESAQVIKEISEKYGYMTKEGVAEVKRLIDFWGNKGLTAEEVRLENKYPNDMVDIYTEYGVFKKAVGYIDFNDILTLTNVLFTKFPEVLAIYANKYKHVLLDEAQDVNNLNVQLLYQLTSVHNNYMLFGDDFQAIYKFRGGDVQNIFDIRERDDEVNTILLERNFRSTKTIVKASNALIAHNKNQMEKVSYSENQDGSPIFIYDASDETREVDFIVEVIQGLVKAGTYTYSDFFVLYRSHFLSRVIEFGMSRAGVPYEVIGGLEFYERAEVKTLVAYMRALDNSLDDIAFERIINTPKRGIGQTTIDRLKMYASENQISFFKAMDFVEDIPKINKPTKKRIGDLVKLIKDGQQLALAEDTEVQDVFNYILNETKFLDQYDKDKTKDIEKIENINELWKVAQNFDRKDREDLVEGQSILNQFLTETALYAPDENADRYDRVKLLTSHSSKGLEAPVVFVVGLEEGTFPSYRTETEEEHEEERRLFYVAMTRAEKLLFLTHNRKSYRRGQEINNRPSRYISEIPDEFKHQLGRAHENSSIDDM